MAEFLDSCVEVYCREFKVDRASLPQKVAVTPLCPERKHMSTNAVGIALSVVQLVAVETEMTYAKRRMRKKLEQRPGNCINLHPESS